MTIGGYQLNLIRYIFILCLSVISLGGCESQRSFKEESHQLKVVSTIFPSYDLIRQIAGDKVDLTLLLAPGVESHSYEPTPKDIITISQSDIFIYAGGDSDTWVNEILSSIDTSEMTIISLVDCIEALEADHDHQVTDDESIVELRPLSDFSGSFKPVISYVKDGSLNEYMEQAAKERDQSAEDIMTFYLKKYATEFQKLTIDGQTLTIETNEETLSAHYTSVGYEVNQSDNHDHYWFLYEITEPVEGMPTRLAFNDHHHTSHDHTHEPRHFYLNYGDESFEQLIQQSNWSPSFYEIEATAEDILSVFMEDYEFELDEHMWTSPKQMMTLVQMLTKTLVTLDQTNEDWYEANAASYLTNLETIDYELQELIQTAKRQTIVVGDRFPFKYLAHDYGLTYYSALSACSTDTEVSPAMIASLIDYVKEEHIPVVFSIELSSGNIAKTIVEATGAKQLTLHSAHNISKVDFEAGITYLDLMQENLKVLKEALN